MGKHKIAAVVAYDGTQFLGWQKTKEGRSVQQSLEEVLKTLYQEEIEVIGASRTDRGVHARGQVASFCIPHQRYSLSEITARCNALLDRDLRLMKTWEVPFSFHPTLDAEEKHYRYEVYHESIYHPQTRLYAWHLDDQLDLDLIKAALPFFLGKKDFTAFENYKKGNLRKNGVCDLRSFDCRVMGSQLTFDLKGNRFLYKMVRNLIGTIVFIGRKKIHLEQIPSFFLNSKRCLTGMTAPACGLSLDGVYYPFAFRDVEFLGGL